MRQKLEVGNNKFILIQRPMFIIAEKLVQLHGLKQNKVYTPGKYIQFFKFLEGDWPRDENERARHAQLLFYWLLI